MGTMEPALSFWYDNWTKQGALDIYLQDGVKPKNVLLKDILIEGNWIYDKTEVEAPDSVITIVAYQHLGSISRFAGQIDMSASAAGNFSMASAWECLRHKKEHMIINTKIWH